VNLSRRAPAHLPDGAYDVRGWEVRTEVDGEKVGKVDDMLVDDQDRPRYLNVKLGIFRRNVLVPLSAAHADPSTQVIWIEQLDRERLKNVPEYVDDVSLISPEYEERLLQEYRSLSRERGTADRRDGDEPLPRLARLSDLGDFRVAKGVTDPRGWKLVAGDGHAMGEVKELIVDAAALTARYLDVEIDEDKLDLEPLNRHILIPAERVRLDRKSKHVVVDGLFARDMRDYPMYQGLPLDDSAQRAIDSAYRRPLEERPGESSVGRFFRPRMRPEDEAAPVRSRRRELDGDRSDRDIERVVSETDVEEYEIPSSENVRIRISGDDIIIERHPRGGRDDG
jgi:sporulation protein YlmC with PRC-barrel domain